jgi:exopolysaccharide biosynthesis polyprenyl glycosylphosphotransferase
VLREHLDGLKKLLFLAYLSSVIFAFQLSYYVESWLTGQPFYFSQIDQLLPIVAAAWGLTLWYYKDFYSFRLKSRLDLLFTTVRVSVIASGLYLPAVFFIGPADISKSHTAIFFGMALVGLAGIRLALKLMLDYFRRRGFNYQTILIVGRGRRAKSFADKIFQHAHWGYRITGFLFSGYNAPNQLWSYRDIPAIGNLSDLPRIIKSEQVDWLVFAVENAELGKIEKAVALCDEMGVRAIVLTDLYPARFASKRAVQFFDNPVLLFDTMPERRPALIMKSIFDRAVALGGLIIVSPILLLTSLIIMIFAKGPILYKQERLGKNGKKFTMYKFRTMIPDAEKLKDSLNELNEMDGPVFKIKNDPRITPLGRFLRKTSIDELPQLFNVLKGDMSLVGPRPPLSNEVVQYDPWQRRRLSMKPGITCLWQIGGRNDISFSRWMEMDLNYIDNWSLWLDTKILAKTIPVVISRKGAR